LQISRYFSDSKFVDFLIVQRLKFTNRIENQTDKKNAANRVDGS